MNLIIEHNSGLPIYRQIVDQLRDRILAGQMKEGERVQSVRDLSAILQVNPLTVSKAYKILEQEAWLETRRGMGTFVKGTSKDKTKVQRQDRLMKSIIQLAKEAETFGVSQEEVVKLIREAFETIKKEKGKKK